MVFENDKHHMVISQLMNNDKTVKIKKSKNFSRISRMSVQKWRVPLKVPPFLITKKHKKTDPYHIDLMLFLDEIAQEPERSQS